MERKNGYIYGSAAPKLPEKVQKPLERKVAQPKKIQRPLPATSNIPKAKFIFGILFVVAISFVILYRFSALAELNYRMGTMTKQYDKLREENRMLKVDIETSINLDHVKDVAENKLNMHKPERYQVVLVSVPKNNYSVVMDQAYINEKTGKSASLIDNLINTFKAVLP